MQSLKQIRNRIKAVRETLKVTSAMQVVSGVKLRRGQARIQQSRPYARRMHLMLRSLHNRFCLNNECSPLLTGTGSDARHLYLLFSTERGLCGPLNSNLVRFAEKGIERLRQQGKSVAIICVGKKAYKLLKPENRKNVLEVVDIGNVLEVRFKDVQEIAGRLFKLFDDGKYDIFCQLYSKFESVSRQAPKSQQLIPVRFARLEQNASLRDGERYQGRSACEFEPEEIEFFRELLPHYIESQIYRAMLENAVSEQAARMMAMDRASRNAREIVDQQTLAYNKLRQLKITNEINEIISGIR